MENAYNIFAELIRVLPLVKKELTPFAKRSGISADAALSLALLSEFCDLELYIDDKIKNELSDNALTEYTENGISLNGKGAILAKSFINVIKKCG